MAYSLEESISKSQEQLNSSLKEKEIKHCGPSDMSTIGWEQLLDGDDTSFVLKASGAYLMTLVVEEKDIPSSVVNEELKNRSKEIEKREGRKLKKKEKDDLKDNIIAKMKPHAFVKTKRIQGYLDLTNKKLVVNTSSAKVGDLFTSFLRDTIEKLPIAIYGQEIDIAHKLTQYLREEKDPEKFAFGYECNLKSMDAEGAKITAKNQELFTDEIKNHIESGKVITDVELTWQERIRFKVDNTFKIKSIKPLDIVQQTISDDLGESVDEYAMMVANYTVMVEDFNEILLDLAAIK
jgi:recombination associated protein RdgC